MSAAIELSAIDWAAFAGYFLLMSLIGYIAGRKKKNVAEDSADYFLAGRSLPWYVVGSSYIAANISTEHFIGLVGAAFIYGIAVATGEWSTVIAFTFMIWIFIPFLLSAKVFTAPEFLEQRFNSTLRMMFAIVTVIANIVAFLAPVIYGGGLAMDGLLGINQLIGADQDSQAGMAIAIFVIGFAAGLWAVWGGLKSVAWMDVLTIIVKIIGGSLVTIFGLIALGQGDLLDGFSIMIERNRAEDGAWAEAMSQIRHEIVNEDSYNRLSVIQPLSHQVVPWTHWVFSFFYIGLWYTVINQFLIQRVFAAKDMYHARMGMVFASFLKLLLPFIVVIPGLIYFAMKPEIILAGNTIDDVRPIADQTYINMIKELIPYGIKGILLAALFGAIQSTVSAVLTSTSTVITMDFYKRFMNPAATEERLVVLGRVITAIVLVLSILLGIWISTLKVSLFIYIQQLFTFFAPPFSAIFLLGAFWRRVDGVAATTTVIAGFALGIAFKIMVETNNAPELLVPYANQGVTNWLFCLVFCAVLSLFTPDPRPEQITDKLTFSLNALRNIDNVKRPWFQSVGFWSLLSLVSMFSLVFLFSVVLA